jgi:hypothetical protein
VRVRIRATEDERVKKLLYLGACALTLNLGVGAKPLLADETCNSPFLQSLIKGQEQFLHVWTLGVNFELHAMTIESRISFPI